MPRIDRPTINADVRAKAVHLDKPLRAIVTSLAERLERAKPEFVDVAVMWLDVVADFRRRDETALVGACRGSGCSTGPVHDGVGGRHFCRAGEKCTFDPRDRHL